METSSYERLKVLENKPNENEKNDPYEINSNPCEVTQASMKKVQVLNNEKRASCRSNKPKGTLSTQEALEELRSNSFASYSFMVNNT